jgi:hypothetical protein
MIRAGLGLSRIALLALRAGILLNGTRSPLKVGRASRLPADGPLYSLTGVATANRKPPSRISTFRHDLVRAFGLPDSST